MKWNKEIYFGKEIMKEKFTDHMSKEEMLQYYANKIVEDGIKGCLEFNAIIPLRL